jgi:hypothetical protein
MRRLSLLVFSILAALAVMLVPTRPALAIKPFKDEFDKKYKIKSPGSDTEKSLAEKVNTAKCNVCHEGTSKKKRNPYGQALDAYLDKKTDMKDMAKIQDALSKVEAEHSVKGDDKSPTFGDLIKQGKLPGGDVAPGSAGGDDDK